MSSAGAPGAPTPYCVEGSTLKLQGDRVASVMAGMPGGMQPTGYLLLKKK
jgi:hypothetical protein